VRRVRLTAALFLALAATSSPAQEAPRPVEVERRVAAALDKATPDLEAAQRALAAKDWSAAVEAYSRALPALGEEPALGGNRDGALYNVACAKARLGRVAEAADAFAASVKNGLRATLLRGPAGAWMLAPGLTLEHVLADADIDPIRKEPAYSEALRPYLAAGEPVVEFTGEASSYAVPAIVVLAAEGEDAERALPAWRVAARDRAVALVAVAGPVRATPRERRWILGDGDERWAVAKLKETLDIVSKDIRVDPKRIFLVGFGASPGEAAWAAALADAKRVAGVAAPGARFHAAWHADAVAALPATWRVALFAADERPAKLLKVRGIEAAVVEPSKDESTVAAAVLDAMLGKP
jgi:hypothetical protein